MKKLLILAVLALGFTSCDDEVLITDDRASGPKIVGFLNTAENVSYFSDEGVVEKLIPVNLIGLGDGNLPTSNLDLNFEVDLVNSTAVEGVEFTFANSSRSLTIPAGSSFATIVLNVITGQLNTTQETRLILNLVPNSGATVSESQKQVVISFVGCQSQFVPGSYSMLSTAGFSSSNVSIIEVAPNVFQFPFPGISAGGSPIATRFGDTCGVLSLLGWDYDASNAVSSSAVSFGAGGTNPNVVVFEQLKIHSTGNPTSSVLFDRMTTTYTKN